MKNHERTRVRRVAVGPAVSVRCAIAAAALALLAAGCGATESATSNGTSTPKADKPDTGRMSTGEFDSLRADLQTFTDEVSAYGTALAGKCATIATAGQAAEFFNCEEDAFDGVIGSYSIADDNLKSLRTATAKTCRKRVTSMKVSLNNYADAVAGTHKLFADGTLATGDPSGLLGEAATTLITTRGASFAKRVKATMTSCESR